MLTLLDNVRQIEDLTRTWTNWLNVAYVERIDDQHANPLQAWIDMGSPLYPTRKQLDKIMRESEMIKKPITYTIIDSTTIQFTLTMPPQSVASITFEL